MKINLQANRSFREVDLSTKRYIIMKGSAGSGKSVDTAQNYILRLLKDKGRNLVCVRKADVTNRDSTYAELCSAIYRMFGERATDYWQMKQSPMEIICKANGNKIIFRGMNDDRQREKLKSITFEKGKLTDVWLEEATELTQADFEIIDDRLRGELPEGQFYQIRATFNPVSASHWIKRVFFDIQDDDVLTHHSTYENNRFIDSAYRKRMLRRKEVDPEGYRVYGLGEWGELGGLIIKDDHWKVENVSKNFNDYDDISIGQDFGYNHANAILVLGIKDEDIYILKEIYVYEMDTSEIIREANKQGIPKNIEMWCDSAEPDRIKMWQDAGYQARGVNKGGTEGSVKAQIEWLKGIASETDVVARTIHVDSTCVNTIKELQQWKWKRDERTGVYLDKPVPFFDDAMAALRYGIEGWRKPIASYNPVVGGY